MRGGQLHGKVYFKYENGDTYNGKCKDFQKHGKGCYIYANGDYVTGKYKNDKLVGTATFYDKSEDTHYACVYKDGKQISKTKIS